MNVFIVSIPNEVEGKRSIRIRNGFEENFFALVLIYVIMKKFLKGQD